MKIRMPDGTIKDVSEKETKRKADRLGINLDGPEEVCGRCGCSFANHLKPAQGRRQALTPIRASQAGRCRCGNCAGFLSDI